MKRMKSVICVALALCVIFAFASCGEKQTNETDDGKISIVATVFPIYDWLRNLTKDVDGVELTMLLDSGTDLHNFQPTSEDIIKVHACDMFAYVGGESDTWVEDILRDAREDMIKLSMLGSLEGSLHHEEDASGVMQSEEEEHEEEESFDEHVWLSVKLAKKCCEALEKSLETLDPDNALVYKQNLAGYSTKLDDLDKRYEQALTTGETNIMLFADRYPFSYMAKDYSLECYAAFKGCSAETEASVETVKRLVDVLNEKQLKHVVRLESSDGKLAETIISNSQAKSADILSVDSMQSVTADDLAAGADYISIMEKNLEVFTLALN